MNNPLVNSMPRWLVLRVSLPIAGVSLVQVVGKYC
mgnify:FL=1